MTPHGSNLRPPVYRSRAFGAAVGLGILLLFNLVYAPAFFRVEIRDGHLYGALIDILNQGSKVMLLALGMTLVIATRGVDLSVGSVMAIAGAAAAVGATQTSLPLGAILVLALALATTAGASNGLLVAAARIQPIIATLILMVAGRGIAMLMTGGQIVTFENPALVFLANGHLFGLPFAIFIVAAMFVFAWLMTNRTALGLFITSMGDNEQAARFSGINTALARVVVYAWCGLCAGMAGLIATSNIKAADSSRVGEMMELDAILAVVGGGTALTGGRFTLVGSIIGALVIQTLTTTMYNLGIPPAIAPVPKALMVVGICLLQSARFRAELARIFHTFNQSLLKYMRAR